MNDFIKIKYVDKKYQLPNAKMDFNISVNNETGETDGKLTGSYYDMKVIKYPSQRTMVQGSIHKFFNRTNFNGNDFTFENQCNTIINLQDELGINPDYCKLENIEIGVNLPLPFNPNLVLENHLFHQNTEFCKPIPNAYYYQAKKSHYIIKIYNKTAQYKYELAQVIAKLKQGNIDDKTRKDLEFLKAKIETEMKENILRFEIKYTKMQIPNALGIVCLSDLMNPEIVSKFKDLLIQEFEQVYFYDYTFRENEMKNAEIIKLKDYRNPKYWANLNRRDRYYHKNKFNEMTQKYSSNIKSQIINIISQKADELFGKDLDFLTNNPRKKKEINFGLFDHSNIGEESPNKTGKNFSYTSQENFRECVVTGMDISMQREGLPYLKREGLRLLYKTNQRRFYQIRDRFMPMEFITKSLEEQIVRIESNIRHTYDNKALCQRLMQERNYHPNQLQFNFIQ